MVWLPVTVSRKRSVQDAAAKAFYDSIITQTCTRCMQQHHLHMAVSLHRRVQDACSNTTYIWQYHYTDVYKMHAATPPRYGSIITQTCTRCMQQHHLHMAVALHRHVQDAATKTFCDTVIAQMQQQKLPITIIAQKCARCSKKSWICGRHFYEADTRLSLLLYRVASMDWHLVETEADTFQTITHHVYPVFPVPRSLVFCGNSQVYQFLVAWNG